MSKGAYIEIDEKPKCRHKKRLRCQCSHPSIEDAEEEARKLRLEGYITAKAVEGKCPSVRGERR